MISAKHDSPSRVPALALADLLSVLAEHFKTGRLIDRPRGRHLDEKMVAYLRSCVDPELVDIFNYCYDMPPSRAPQAIDGTDRLLEAVINALWRFVEISDFRSGQLAGDCAIRLKKLRSPEALAMHIARDNERLAQAAKS